MNQSIRVPEVQSGAKLMDNDRTEQATNWQEGTDQASNDLASDLTTVA